MRAVLVSVDYTDLLRVTLPRNRHHFSEMTVITSPADLSPVEEVCLPHDVRVLATDLFYRDGATFNKWRALEWGLDVIGREGWLCLMDADVIWPHEIPAIALQPGKLYTPLRRMMVDQGRPIPPESEWSQFPLHRNLAEWAGYSQIFHARDPHLGPAPWHETNWIHAGGADSFFQAKWPPGHKVRPSWEVLHLGPAGTNWLGRASPLMDGTLPEESLERQQRLRDLVRRRKPGPGRFDAEKLP